MLTSQAYRRCSLLHTALEDGCQCASSRPEGPALSGKSEDCWVVLAHAELYRSLLQREPELKHPLSFSPYTSEPQFTLEQRSFRDTRSGDIDVTMRETFESKTYLN